MIKTDTRWAVCAGAIVMASALLTSGPVSAETLETALAQAYRNNPTLNAQRASQRATDELVPQALANYRPRVNASIDSGFQHFESNVLAQGQQLLTNTNISPRGGNVGVVQTLYNGQRSGNLTRQAEASVLSGRETLRNVEQN